MQCVPLGTACRKQSATLKCSIVYTHTHVQAQPAEARMHAVTAQPSIRHTLPCLEQLPTAAACALENSLCFKLKQGTKR